MLSWGPGRRTRQDNERSAILVGIDRQMLAIATGCRLSIEEQDDERITRESLPLLALACMPETSFFHGEGCSFTSQASIDYFTNNNR